MWVALRDIVDVRPGFPFRGKIEPEADGTLAVVQMRDVDEVAGLNLSGCARIHADEKRYGHHALQRGDVLLQARGHRLPAVELGKPIVGIAAAGLYVLRPKSGVDPAFLAWLLNHPKMREGLLAIARGTYIPFLSKADLQNLQLPVPDHRTQERIAETARLRATERRLASRLRALTDQLVDDTAWKAAVSAY
jgi:Type I restriction modification DNA specificity domain